MLYQLSYVRAPGKFSTLKGRLQAPAEAPFAGEHHVAQQEEADRRGHRDGDQLGHVPRQVSRYLGVDEHGPDQQEEEPIADADVEERLRGEKRSLPRVAPLRPALEGPARVPQVAVDVCKHERHTVVEGEHRWVSRRREPQEQVERADVDDGVDETDDRELREAEDRKSTRLNSSHANISYAVFCLKKKKKFHKHKKHQLKSSTIRQLENENRYIILPTISRHRIS